MDVLVTGGAGYIGSALVAKLLSEKHKVISVDNLSRGNHCQLEECKGNPSLRFIVEDVCNIRGLQEIMKHTECVDALVHLAAVPGLENCLRNPEEAVLTNVHGTYNLLKIAREYDLDRIVFASSAAVYGNPARTPIREDHPLNPANLYGVTKVAAEKLVNAHQRSYGLDGFVLRFGNVYGIGVYTHWETVIPKFVRQGLSGEPLTIYGDGEQSRDFVHVWDAVSAILLALKTEDRGLLGETFNVCTGQSTSVNVIAQIVTRIFREDFGKRVETKYLPPREEEPLIPDFCLSSEKSRKELGFRPYWNIEDGVRQLAKYRSECCA